MTRFGSAALTVLVLLCGACHEASDMNTSNSVPPTAMNFRGYDDTGHLFEVGWIDLGIVTVPAPPVPPGPPSSLDFSGTWKICPPDDPGGGNCQSGALAWGFWGESIVVELHPGNVDNDWSLTGTMSAEPNRGLRYEGTWRWQGIGSSTNGTFRAWR